MRDVLHTYASFIWNKNSIIVPKSIVSSRLITCTIPRDLSYDYHKLIFKNDLNFIVRSVCGYGTVSVVENATGTVPYS